jgi:hypothetical protein
MSIEKPDQELTWNLKKETWIDRSIGVFLFTVVLLSVWTFAGGAWGYFKEICPNTDVLTWDENIRLNTVLDQYNDFKNGNILTGVIPFLESPTWPPLRSLITFIMLWIPMETPITHADSFLGLLFLVATFLSVAWIGYKITSSLLLSGVITLSAVALSLQTYEVPAYSLSSMLETQSMFFLVWCIYFLYKIYSPGISERSETISGSLGWGLGLSLFLFFFTKYPYGLMLFMAICIVEFVRSPGALIAGAVYAFRYHYKGLRRVLFVLVVVLIFSLPILRLVGDLNLNQRPFKMFLYFVSLPIFIDFNYFLWAHRGKLSEIFPVTLRKVYTFAMLPALVWIYTSPDRVSSLVDAQMIVNKFTKSFFLSLVSSHSGDFYLPMAVFDSPIGIRILLGLAGLGIFIWTLRKLRGKDKKSLFAEVRIDPLVSVSLVLFLQILILETTTGNKQLRHILQFIPALSLLLWLWVFRFRKIFPVLGSFFAAIGFFFTIWGFAGPEGLWSGAYFGTKHFCLKGEDPSLFSEARWISNQVPKDKNLLILNGFHEEFNYEKRGRLFASEIDLLIRIPRYKEYKIRHDNRHKWKTWTEFSELVLISYSCEDPLLREKLKKRSETTGSALYSLGKSIHPSGEFCVERFRIQPRTDTGPIP